MTLHRALTYPLPLVVTSAATSPVAARLEAIARKGSELTACNGTRAAAATARPAWALYYARHHGRLAARSGIYSWSPEVYGGDEYFVVERSTEQ